MILTEMTGREEGFQVAEPLSMGPPLPTSRKRPPVLGPCPPWAKLIKAAPEKPAVPAL